MNVKILPSTASGKIVAPPSKSMAHRLILGAALANGTSTINNIEFSEDILATVDCVCALGAKVERVNGGIAVSGIESPQKIPSSILYCRESGSTMRFIIPLCLISGNEFILRGSERLLQRPYDIFEEICRKNGFLFEREKEQIRLKGSLRGGYYEIPGNISSQFITGLLFALPLMAENSSLYLTTKMESASYTALTLEALNRFGVKINSSVENAFIIGGNQKYTPISCEVEGDFSNAAFFDALGFLGGEVEVEGLNENSLQGDRVYKKLFKQLKNNTPEISLADCPDLAPVLFALAAAENGAVFTSTSRLKIKESDRGAAMAQELAKFGVNVIVEENKITVEKPQKLLAPTVALNGHNDHRIVMALTVLATLTGAQINGAEAVKKSLPGFFEACRKLKIKIEE